MARKPLWDRFLEHVSLQEDENKGNVDLLHLAHLSELVSDVTCCYGSGMMDTWDEERLARAVNEASRILREALNK